MNRRDTMLALIALAGAPVVGVAQPVGRVLRIAILEDASENARPHLWKAFRKRLGELGYTEGKNLVIEARYARGNAERLHALAVELIALRPDIIVTAGTPSTRTAMRATSSIPIVFTSGGDPVGSGLVASLARPGGNATGASSMSSEIGAKWIQLIREIAPGAKRIAFLGDMANKGTLLSFSEVQEQARPLDVTVQMLDGRRRTQLDRSFDTIIREHFDGLIVGASGVLLDLREQIVQFAARHRLPTVYARRDYVDAGGLLFYGVEQTLLFQHAAEYVHRIAQGAKPSELPVGRPNVIRLIVNLKTAHALGIKIPQSLVLRADELIK